MPTPVPTYESAPYRSELATTVVDSGIEDERHFAVFDDTLFYPEGGGQPGDRGSVNRVPVLDVQRVEGVVRHYVVEPVELGAAELRLDWPRRFDHMQQHTAQHLLSALALELFDWRTTSFHLGETRCDIELETDSIDLQAIEELERRLRQEIRAARPVTARRISADDYRALDIRSRGLPEGHEGEVRLVEIEGIDLTTCGGTHLRSTAEIESLRLGPTERLRGGTRLFWIAGERVARRLATLEARNQELRRLLETSGEELVQATAARLEALKETRRRLKKQSGELADARSSELAATADRRVEAHFEGVDGGFLQGVARGLLARAPSKVALLTATGPAGSFFLIAAGAEAGIEFADLGARVAGALDGRGGGSKTIFQGKAASLERRAEAVALLAQA